MEAILVAGAVNLFMKYCSSLIALVIVSVILTGCQSSQPLYYHGNYNQFLYKYLSNKDYLLEEQIENLLAIINRAETRGKQVAPGVHESLGMLYVEIQQPTLGLMHFEMEKQLFPESRDFIDVLINRSVSGIRNVTN